MDIIKYLITEHGCDPALPDNDGDMPINIACQLNVAMDVVKYLVTRVISSQHTVVTQLLLMLTA